MFYWLLSLASSGEPVKSHLSFLSTCPDLSPFTTVSDEVLHIPEKKKKPFIQASDGLTTVTTDDIVKMVALTVLALTL